ncbi:MAG: hypothetical protein NT124_00005 [Candidatus Dependentiae bacterium]|nr:hypothetical protein [Candidatus Dependentiae bacterium]
MKKRISILSIALLLSGFSVVNIDAIRQAIKNDTNKNFTGKGVDGAGWPISYKMTFTNCPGSKNSVTFTRYTGMVYSEDSTKRLAAGQGELGDEWRNPNAGMQIPVEVTIYQQMPKHAWAPAGDPRATEMEDKTIKLQTTTTQGQGHGARTANLWMVVRNPLWWDLTDEQRRQSIQDTKDGKNTTNPEFQIHAHPQANNDQGFGLGTFVDLCNRNPGNPACGK